MGYSHARNITLFHTLKPRVNNSGVLTLAKTLLHNTREPLI